MNLSKEYYNINNIWIICKQIKRRELNQYIKIELNNRNKVNLINNLLQKYY